MRPLGVVIFDPAGKDRARLTDREEQRLVEQLVAHATIKALDEHVLRWSAGCDIMPLDPDIAAPGQHRVRRQLRPVVADDHLRCTAPGDQIAQLAHDPPVRDRRIDHRRQALARHVIDDVDHPEASLGDELIVDKVQAPALVRKRQHRRRGPRADGASSSLPAAHRQPFLPIEPLRLFAVDGDAVPAEQDMQAAIAEPPTLLRQLTQPRPQVAIIGSTRAVSHTRAIRSNDSTRPLLVHPQRHLKMRDSFPLRGGRHHFF